MSVGITVLQVLELSAEPAPLSLKLGALGEDRNNLLGARISVFKTAREQGAFNFQAVESVSIGLKLDLQLRKSLHVRRLLFGHFTQVTQLEGAQPGFLLFQILLCFLELRVQKFCGVMGLLLTAF